MGFWGDAYRGSPPWDIGRPQPAFIQLVKTSELRPGRVLDVGCGTGENAIFLAQNGYESTGVDLTPQAIQIATKKATDRKIKVKFEVGNALELGFKSGTFDDVVDSGLFHTFTDDERRRFVEQIGTVLRKDGKYFMLCFSDKEPTIWGGPRRVTKKEVEETLKPVFKINYIRDAFFATRIHEQGGKAYLTSATKVDGEVDP